MGMFLQRRADSSASLVAFVMCGYPSLADTSFALDELDRQAVPWIELGVPFSDPIADGPVLIRAADHAVAQGVSLDSSLQLIHQHKNKGLKAQVVLFTYLNPVLAMGLELFAQRCFDSGVAAVLVVDAPAEELMQLRQCLQQRGIGQVVLASPTTSQARLQQLEGLNPSFVYYVSRLGVTGQSSEVSSTLSDELNKLRQYYSGPVAVGFGISTATQAREVAQWADGVVVGSALVEALGHSREAFSQLLAQLVAACRQP